MIHSTASVDSHQKRAKSVIFAKSGAYLELMVQLANSAPSMVQSADSAAGSEGVQRLPRMTAHVLNLPSCSAARMPLGLISLLMTELSRSMEGDRPLCCSLAGVDPPTALLQRYTASIDSTTRHTCVEPPSLAKISTTLIIRMAAMRHISTPCHRPICRCSSFTKHSISPSNQSGKVSSKLAMINAGPGCLYSTSQRS